MTAHTEFHSFAMLEEVNADAADSRVAWVAQDSLIIGKELSSQVSQWFGSSSTSAGS